MYGKLLGALGVATIAAAALVVLQPRAMADAAAGPPPVAAPNPASGIIDAQRRLAALGYDVGRADGVVGTRTRFAIIAFQKVERLERSGVIDEPTVAALSGATPPRAIVPAAGLTRVEVDLTRQVLLFWRDGRLARVLPVSTGDGKRYCTAAGCERAITPTGTFRIARKVGGVDPGPLGKLYDPMYFHRGVAIHGAQSVPAHPASHGCVRIPLYASASFAAAVPLGTPVHVVTT